MAEEKAPNAEKDKIGAVKAYDILLQRLTNEDRILGERTSIFLLATSFLFLAFATLLNPAWTGYIFTVLRILLPCVGIALTTLLYCFNQNAVRSVAFWHDAQRKIEEDEEAGVFEYMKAKDISPHIGWREFMKGDKEWVLDEDDNLILGTPLEPMRWYKKRRKGEKEWVQDKDGNLILGTLLKPMCWYEKRMLSSRTIYKYYLPLTFLTLWIASLVVVIVRTVS